MTIFRAAAVIDAPHAAVVRALRSGLTWRRTARALGGRLDAPAGALTGGDTLTFTAGRPWGPSRRFSVSIDDAGLPELHSSGRDGVTLSLDLSPTGAGVLTRLDYRSSASAIGTAIARRRVLRAGELLLGIATLIAREPLIVVAGALIGPDEQGRPTVLAAHRAAGPSGAAGGWELPGGKVETGESEPDALRRELREELGIDVIVGSRLGPDVDLGDGLLLRAFDVRSTTTPTAREHSELRRLTAAELDSVDWLPADRYLLPALSERL